MRLREVQNAYKKAEITRFEANKLIMPVLDVLYDLSDLIKESCISKIELDGTNIVFTIEYEKEQIKLCAEQGACISVVSNILATNTVEAELEDNLYELIPENAVVFDIGANIGWYSVCIAKHHPDVQVFSFEPIFYTFLYLKKNLQLNSLSTERIYNIGLSDENKQAIFYFNNKCTETSSMRDLKYINDESQQIECKIRRLDDFCTEQKIDHVDFIKCDVEGAEFFVFRGGLETIKKSRPVIFTEMLRKWSSAFDYHPNDIILLLASLDYVCIALNRNGKKRILMEVNEDTEEMNYLFIPQEKLAETVSKLKGFTNG